MTVKLSKAGRRGLAGAALMAALLAASCGGGEQVNAFHPTRVIVFGDESSLIVDLNNDGNGAKYTINATVSTTDPTLDCSASPLWVQDIAVSYGFVFPQCNPASTSVTAPVARIRATAGAQAADLTTQIDTQQADDPIHAGDLVTVLIGENDIIAQYQRYPTVSEPELIAAVQAAGQEAGRQVNRLTELGAKVLLATTFDPGITPFGLAEQAGHADTDRAALLTRMTTQFNAALRGTIVNDGRVIGLVLLDELISALVKFPGLDGFTDVIDPACDLSQSKLTPPSSLDCTSLTLVANGSSAFLWADDRHLSASAQNLFGSNALVRVQNNPF
jgi:outer membrane lipase/esterase